METKVDVSFRVLPGEVIIALFTTGLNFFVEENWTIGERICNKTLYDMYGTSEYSDPISHFSKPTMVFEWQKQKVLNSYLKTYNEKNEEEK